VAELVAGPVNVQVRRVSATALQVSWDPPPAHLSAHLVTGYRLYHRITATTSPGDDPPWHAQV